MPIHNEWLLSCTERYGFDNVDEVLRHLIYLANSESKQIKKLIFKTVRCLHCHVGARADQHKKVDLGTTKASETETTADVEKTMISIHTFHYEWLARVKEICKIASIEKVVRIIIDYYQSRVKQVYHSDGPKAASAKELLLFGKNRHNDPRYAAVLQRKNERTSKKEQPATTIENETSTTTEISNDPAACSQEEIDEAIKRCQVGRNSASYAVAMKETPEETEARRAKEILVEKSEETKLAREQIRKALGSPMG